MWTKGSNKSVWNQLPQGVVALFCIQIFSTLSFSVLYSTLVLYMTGSLSLSAHYANTIMGVFVAFNFALHLLGGYWGGRFLSNRTLFCIGMFAQVIGCMLLATIKPGLLNYGLAAFLTGSGLNVTCLNCMLTQRFKPEDTRRESAFLFNYAGMNIGFFVGFTLSGYFQVSHNYQRLFLVSSIGNLIALLICLYNWHALSDENTLLSKLSKRDQKRFTIKGVVLVLCMPIVLSHLLLFADMANRLVLLTGIVMIAVIYVLALKQPTKEFRNKLFAFSILMVIGTVFWTLFQIGPMGLTNFINNNVERNLSTFIIPPQWFQNVNTICVVIGGPALSLLFNHLRKKGVSIYIPVQFAIALFLIGLAFVILPIGISFAGNDGLVSSGWIVLCFFLQSMGELLISPIGYAMIGLLAPEDLQGVMMGMWMLATGVGATLASYSSNWMTVGQESTDPLITNAGYSSVFLYLGIAALAASLVLFILTPLIKRWINDKKEAGVNASDLAAA